MHDLKGWGDYTQAREEDNENRKKWEEMHVQRNEINEQIHSRPQVFKKERKSKGEMNVLNKYCAYKVFKKKWNDKRPKERKRGPCELKAKQLIGWHRVTSPVAVKYQIYQPSAFTAFK